MQLLIPGRHHLLTQFQHQYLTMVTSKPLSLQKDSNGKPLAGNDEYIDTILWAITSANHSHTMRNPLPANRREVMIEEFGETLSGTKSYVYHIDDIGRNERFGEYIIKKIAIESREFHHITPENTIIGCSTPGVIDMYERLGFRVLPFELDDKEKETYIAARPWELVEHIVEVQKNGLDYKFDDRYLQEVSSATRGLYEKYSIGESLYELFTDGLLGGDGDLTETRDYNTYVRAFDNGAERKYEQIKDYIKPGKVVDIGCCTGKLLEVMSQYDRCRESDLYGIEAARVLYDECVHRKEHGTFGIDNVFFLQRNVATSTIFPDNSIDFFSTFSLTHEIESYQSRETLLRTIELLYKQTSLGGRWVNVDVVGPENADQIIYLELNDTDGKLSGNETKEDDMSTYTTRDTLRNYLDGLTTYGRFLRFAQDFRKDAGYKMQYEIIPIEGKIYAKLSYRDACEFVSKKDYTDNRQSEMHETFCYRSFTDWKKAVTAAGFTVHENSEAYTNPRLVENRWKNSISFHSIGSAGEVGAELLPPTNMLLICDKLI